MSKHAVAIFLCLASAGVASSAVAATISGRQLIEPAINDAAIGRMQVGRGSAIARGFDDATNRMLAEVGSHGAAGAFLGNDTSVSSVSEASMTRRGIESITGSAPLAFHVTSSLSGVQAILPNSRLIALETERFTFVRSRALTENYAAALRALESQNVVQNPVPASVVLFLTGAAGLFARFRRRVRTT